jgi:plastocyanin
MPRLRLLASVLFASASLVAQDVTLHGRVEVVHRSKHNSGSSDVVVWLTPVGSANPSIPAQPARLIQKDKRFSPHVVVVRVGTEIEFPNQDPFFHDVFSIYRGKPFDLGLYESGTTRKVRFSQGGISYIFCNIHPDMSAAVVAVPTPYYALTIGDGSFQITHLLPGHYKMELWYELASEAELASLAHDIEVGADNQPLAITLHSSDIPAQHLNKYGQEYYPEKPGNY